MQRPAANDAPSFLPCDDPGNDGSVILCRYQVLRCLGRGGMGTVYLVRDQHKDGQHLALKLFRKDSLEGQSYALLRNEFLTLAALQHPNLTRVHDFAVVPETGDVFFTAEFVNGVNLLEATAGLRFSQREDLERLLHLLAQVLRALAFIHSRGMVYSDIKPANILVRPSEPGQNPAAVSDQVKLIDFGLVRRERRHVGKKIWGTPYYVAPETILGASVDRRADLYSLGVVLYQMTTGRLPFSGDSNLEILKGHVEKRPAPPHEVAAGLPPALDGLILRLMEKKPEDRFQNALEVVEALQSLLQAPIPLEVPETLQSYLRAARLAGREHEAARLTGVFLAACQARATESGLEGQAETAWRGQHGLAPEPDPEAAVPAARMILLRGERGSGKRRLLENLRCLAQTYGAQLLACECESRSHHGRKSLRLLVEELLKLCSSLKREAEADALRALLSFLEQDAGHLDLQAVSDTCKDAFRGAARSVLELSKSFPLVLSFHNLDQAGRLLLAFLRGLLDYVLQADDKKTCLLVTATSLDLEDVENQPFLDLFNTPLFQNHVLDIHLDSLDEAGLQLLVRAAFPGCDLPADFLDTVLEKSDGNLRSIVEILSFFLQQRTIQRTPAGWILSGDYSDNQLLGSFRHDIQERIRKLPEEPFRLAVAFAFFNSVHDLKLATALANIPENQVSGCLKLLLEKKVVRERLEPNKPRQYVIANSSTRQALQAMVPVFRRQAIHERAGKLCEEHYQRLGRKNTAAVAYHYLQAGNKEKGVRYGLDAARELAAQSLLVRAIETYERVLQLLGQQETEQGDRIREEIALLRFEVGDYKSVLKLLRPLFRASGAAQSRRVASKMYVLAAKAHCRLGEFQEAARRLQEAARRIRQSAADADVAEVCLGCAELYYFRDAAVESLRYCEQAQPCLERTKDKGALLRALLLAAENHALLGSPEEAARHCQRALRLIESEKDFRELAASFFFRGKYYQYQRQYYKALKQFRFCLLVRSKANAFSGLADCLLEIGAQHRLLGKPQEARSHLERALTLYRRMENKPQATAALCELGEVERLIGEHEQARRSLESALREGLALGKVATASKALLGLAAASYDRGAVSQGDEILKRIESLTPSGVAIPSVSANVLCLQCEAAICLAEYQRGIDSCSAGIQQARELKDPVLLARFLRLQTLQFLQLGRGGEARRSLAALLETAAVHGLVLEEGWGDFLEACTLWSEGKLQAAARSFAAAKQTLTENGSSRDRLHLHLKHGLFQLEQGNLEPAYLEVEEGLYLSTKANLSYMTSWFHLARGLVERASPSGQAARAEESFRRADRVACEGPYLEVEWQARYQLGRLYWQEGNRDEAVRLARLAEVALGLVLERIPPQYRESYLKHMRIQGADGSPPADTLGQPSHGVPVHSD